MKTNNSYKQSFCAILSEVVNSSVLPLLSWKYVAQQYYEKLVVRIFAGFVFREKCWKAVVKHSICNSTLSPYKPDLLIAKGYNMRVC